MVMTDASCKGNFIAAVPGGVSPQDKLTAGKTRHPTLHTRQDGLSAAKPMLNGPTDR